MYDAPGYGPDDDEERRRLLESLIGARSQADAPAAEEERPAGAAETMQFTAPDASILQQSGGSSGFTPPPAASEPAYLEHQAGHSFGAGDGLMIAGILASLIAKKPGLAMSLGGAYGGGLMQGEQDRQANNARIDVYNSQLAEKNNPFNRWKDEQSARTQAGNLSAREKENETAATREKRILDRQAADDQFERDKLDPDSETYKGAMQRARDLQGIQTEGDLARKKGESEIDYRKRKMLGELVSARSGGKLGAPTGKGLKREVEDAKNQALLDGIKDGTVDPITGKRKAQPGDTPEGEDIDPATGKPYSAAAKLQREKYSALQTAFPGTEIEDEAAWKASVTTPGGREKIGKYFQGVQQTNNALRRMRSLREQFGTEVMGSAKSAYDAALTAAIGGFTQIGNSGVLNAGEFERYKNMIPGMGPRMADLGRMVGGQDQTLAELDGVIDEVGSLASDGLSVAGLRMGSSGKKSGGSKATPADAGSFGGDQPTGGGKRMVTMHKGDITDTQELTEEQIQKLKAKGWSE